MIERIDSLREISRLSLITLPSSLYAVTEARDAQRRAVQAADDRAKAVINDRIDRWLKAEPDLTLVGRFLGSLAVAPNPIHDFLLGVVDAGPGLNVDELARFEILVVRKEMGNLVKHDLREIAV